MSKQTLKENFEQLVKSEGMKELAALPEERQSKIVKALLAKIRANKLAEMVAEAKKKESL